ncbi:MAG TPA: NAD(P)/FAD-dependent oxidoreductase [Firmicutes bacterium]|nr:NAD(P)/FAD-dependent oxidoreductase [Bacillota bacterium]
MKKIKNTLQKAFPEIELSLQLDGRGILTLAGECTDWQQVVAVGHRAAKLPGVKNVVNELRVPGLAVPEKDYGPLRSRGLKRGVVADVDLLIIGAGISGCAVARELAKYRLDILVVEMTDDVATGATKANNGNIHPGQAEKPGTLKARLNVEGNRLYSRWAKELDFTLQRCGAMGFITSTLLWPALLHGYRRAVKNGVDGVQLVGGRKAVALEPGLERCGLAPQVKGAMWLPSMGLVEPYQVTVALAENAADNGVRFWFNCTVADILTEKGIVTGAVTTEGIIRARTIINCAGVHADEISAMAGDRCFTIHPRKGVIAILDKAQKPKFDRLCEHITLKTVKQSLQKSHTKGGGMCYTPEKNILMGPSALEIPDKEDLSTSAEELAYAMGRGDETIDYSKIIRIFAGNRPADYSEDFIIEMSPVTGGFINVSAIQSPGLAAAPAIAKRVEQIVVEAAAESGAPLEKNPRWNPIRRRKPEFRHLSRREQDALIQRDPRYGRIICRCETVTEGEILEAIRSPVPPASVDAIKRRTRAGMGRCQGGFCQPRVLELLAKERGERWTEVTLKGEGSNILLRPNRPGAGKRGAR